MLSTTTALKILHMPLILIIATTVSGRYCPSLLLGVRKLKLRSYMMCPTISGRPGIPIQAFRRKTRCAYVTKDKGIECFKSIIVSVVLYTWRD